MGPMGPWAHLCFHFLGRSPIEILTWKQTRKHHIYIYIYIYILYTRVEARQGGPTEPEVL